MLNFSFISTYIKTAFRNIAKNKTFAAINVIGLAISMSVGLIMISFINEVNTYDKFHSNYKNIYRVNNVYRYMDDDPSYFASTSPLAGQLIRENVPGIKKSALVRRNASGDLGFQSKIIPLDGYWADTSFLEIFSFDMIAGDPATALAAPRSIVLTESAAEKLLDGSDPLGQIVTTDESEFTITGIVKDPPFNSTLNFEFLSSFSTHLEDNKDNTGFARWSNMWMYHFYFTVEDGYSVDNIQTAFERISAEQNEADEYTKIDIAVQAMSDIFPGVSLSNEIGKRMEASLIWMIAGLTFVVIISACFNYTNLSIARSLRRSKEVGVRKVVGARGAQVFGQFIVESIVVSLFGLLLALGTFYLIRPYFLAMDSFINEIVRLELSLPLLLQFVLLAVATGVLAGFAPALFFSKLNPQEVLKSGSSIKLFGGLGLRRALIIAQFTLSLMFILAATLEYRQYRHALAFDLGYSTENILNVRLQGNDHELLKAELSKIPEVTSISSSLMITSVGNYWGETLKYEDPLDSISAYYNGIDEFYLPLHDHKLLAGANFKPLKSDSGQMQVIVNERLINRLQIPSGDNGELAIGEVVNFGDEQATIVGVISDFHFGTINSEIRPFLFKYGFSDGDPYMVNVKIESTDLIATMSKIETAWKAIDDIHPIQADFYDDRIQETYSEYVLMVKVIGFLAFLAITIAVMGLLGMVIFTTETRLKEIGIRKVLGASEQRLIVLLSKGFLLLLIASAVIAIPSTYVLFDQVVFADVVYKAPIGPIELFSGVIFVLFVAFLAIGSQTLNAARTNPAKILRNE